MLPVRPFLRWAAGAQRFAASRLGSIVLLLIAIASIQTGASIAKSLFPAVGAEGATALRLVFATLILFLVLRPWRTRIDRRAWSSIAIYGVSLGAMNLLFYLALRTVPLGLAVGLEFTGPMAVAMCSSRRPVDFVWIGCALAGLLLIAPVGGGHAVDLLGAGYALGAGVCWALYMLCGQRAGAAHGMATTAWGMLIAALLVLPVGVWHAGTALLAPALFPCAIGVAALSSALPYTIEMWVLQRMPVRAFGILMSVEPALAAISGWLLLDETLSTRQCLAIAAIVVASVGTTLTMEPRAPLAAVD
jgi:inner membrane transporter RhtA